MLPSSDSSPRVAFAAAAAAFVDADLVGIAVLDQAKRVLWANSRARQILAAGDGLIERGGRLAVGRAATLDAARLEELLASAISGKRGGLTVVGSWAPQRPLTIYANPLAALGERREPLAPDGAAVAVLIVDPWFKPRVCVDKLEMSLGLSPAESRVVARLTAGMSVAEIAQETDRTVNAVRWLVKQALAKTGCRRQADLVRLVLLASRLPVPEPASGPMD